MEFKDYYKTLGVARTASLAEIKKAYRKLARKHHPDLSQAADATAQMAALNEANDVLCDAERRAAYDTLGDAAAAPQAADGRGFRPPPNWDAGFEFADGESDRASPGNFGRDAGEHSDFFEQLFGRAGRAQRAQARGGPPQELRGNDHHAKIELDILDAYSGAERAITLRSAAFDAEGRMVDAERRLQVKIPVGVFEGQQIRLAGRGGAGMGGAPAGDLLLDVRFKPDPRWRAEGRDVYQRVPLAPWEAALGATPTIATPAGSTEVSIPAGWQPGRKLRLKGRGIPGGANSAAGHLYLELELALPPADSEAARAAYAALAQAFPAFAPRQTPGHGG